MVRMWTWFERELLPWGDVEPGTVDKAVVFYHGDRGDEVRVVAPESATEDEILQAIKESPHAWRAGLEEEEEES